jgi:hypothetical protein
MKPKEAAVYTFLTTIVKGNRTQNIEVLRFK